MIALGIGFGFSFSGPADRRRHLRHSARFRRRRRNLSDIPSVVSQGPIRSFFLLFRLPNIEWKGREIKTSRRFTCLTLHPDGSSNFGPIRWNVIECYWILPCFTCFSSLMCKEIASQGFFSHFFLDQKDREKRSRTLILQKKLIFCT